MLRARRVARSIAPMQGVPIRTRSLRLRPFEVDDAAAMLALNAEPSTRHWLPSHVYADLDAARAALADLIGWCRLPADPRVAPYVLAIERQCSRQLIGHVGFSPLRGEVEVSYAVAESMRGQGLGAEALDAACAWALPAFGLPALVACTAFDNRPSRRTLERAGFSHVTDEVTRFQGVEQAVSRYRRTPAAR